MRDLRPRIKANIGLISKSGRRHLIQTGSYACRESVISSVQHSMDYGSGRGGWLDQHTRDKYPHANLVMMERDMPFIEWFSKDTGNKKLRLLRLLDTTIGIMGTAMYSSDDELERRTKVDTGSYVTLSKDVRNGVTIVYKNLPIIWVASPALFSLFTGVARNCLSAVHDDERYNLEMDKLIFDKISWDEVKDIIDKGDSERATRVMENIIYPFWSRGKCRPCMLLNYKSAQYSRHLLNNNAKEIFPFEVFRKHWVQRYNTWGWTNYTRGVTRCNGDMKFHHKGLIK